MAKKKPAARPTATAKPKKMSKANKVDWLERRTTDLVKQRQAFRDAAADFEEAHAASALAKKTMDNEQAKLNAIVNDIADIKTGNFTPPLPFPEDSSSPKKTGVDRGAAMPLSAVDLKPQLLKKLEKALSKNETDIPTVGDLESLQRAKPDYWSKDLGLNGEQTTTVLDAMEAFRKANPMPTAEEAAASNGKPVDPLTKAFTDGQEACRAGKELKSCQYPSGTPLALKWIEGHDAETGASKVRKIAAQSAATTKS